MEEKEIRKERELACKAILAGRLLGSTAVAAMTIDIDELEQYFEAEHSTSESVYSPSPHTNRIVTVSGQLGGEKSYEMDLSDWIEYYDGQVDHDGLICQISDAQEAELHQDTLVYPIDDIAETPLTSESPQIVVPPRTIRRTTAYHFSQNLLNFCLRHGIQERYLQVAIDLATHCFPSIQEVSLQIEQDPETSEEWLVLEATVQGDVDEIIDQYEGYTDLWVSLAPWLERNKIILTYNII